MNASSQYSVVCYGEVLWDILPSGEQAGGAPMNVAYHLNNLGVDTALISKTGADDYGNRLRKEMKRRCVPTDFVQLDEMHKTGLVYAHPNEQHEVTYEIVQPVAWDFIEWKEELHRLVQQSRFFVYGSLSARSETSRNTLFQLLEGASKKVLDINIRPPHFHKDLALQLLRGVDILKLNESELQLLAGWYGSNNNLKEQVAVLQDRLNVPVIIVTRGGQGAMVYAEGSYYEHPGYEVLVSDTVGSGDAFLAGYLYQTLQGAAVQESLDFACAAGALIASHTGACPDYQYDEIKQLMNGYK